MDPPSQEVSILSQVTQEVGALEILIVEDNADCARTTATLLEMYGFDVQTAQNGEEALAAVQDYKPDVVLLDLGLPDMDGYDVAKAIQEAGLAKKPYILAMSGFERDEERSAQCGIEMHFVKSAQLDALEAALRDIQRHNVLVQAGGRLRANPYRSVRKLAYEFENGTLSLRGQVLSYFQKQLAQESVTGIRGVERVVNEVDVFDPYANARMAGAGPRSF